MFGTSIATIELAAQTGALATYCGAVPTTGQQAALQGNALFRLASLAAMAETTELLWDQRFSLDAVEHCAP